MNPLLSRLQPYPFERLRQLFASAQPPAGVRPISLGIGEPRHATPSFIEQALSSELKGLSVYPATAGMPVLREACAQWANKRYGIELNAATQVLPVNGSREALFAFTQVVVDNTQPGARVICPNPFYQIYEGATLLAGATPYYAASDASRNFAVNWDAVPEDVWQKTQLIFVCSPGNPTGAVMPLSEWEKLFALSDKHGFVIASDECYSELYFDSAPIGLLQACAALGRHDFKNCVVFHSLSKRSNLPGLRSGFVAGDANILQPYLQYRTYHGCAMPIPHQLASIAAWEDEKHVAHNRALYQEKFALWMSELGELLDLRMPEAGFYFWVKVPEQFNGDDEIFVKALYEQANIHALAGRYLSREVNGKNPGQGYVRIALVASVEESREAISRIRKLLGA